VAELAQLDQRISELQCRHAEAQERDVDAEFALSWLLWPSDGPKHKDRRWTHNGARALFKFAVLNGLLAVNPFNGLRLRSSNGRAELEVMPNDTFEALAELPLAVHGDRYGLTWRAIRLLLGTRGDETRRAPRPQAHRLRPHAGTAAIERQSVHTMGDYDVGRTGSRAPLGSHPKRLTRSLRFRAGLRRRQRC
jgi:hypothetical protein